MKAITVEQPTAEALLDGAQHVLAAKHGTDYRGRLVLHLTEKVGYDPALCWRRDLAVIRTGTTDKSRDGKVVATCVLAGCAPIGGPTDFPTGLVEGERPAFAGQAVVVHHSALGPLGESLVLDDPKKGINDISDQLPYGDFRPGRWAWLLEDVQPVETRCPACWGSGSYPHLTRLVCCLCHGELHVPPVPARGGPGDLWDWEPPR